MNILRNENTEFERGVTATLATPPPPGSLVDQAGDEDSDEIKSDDDLKGRPPSEASPYRMTRTPQPAATHPRSVPGQPTPQTIPAGALDGFVVPTDLKELHELWVKVNWEFRIATAKKRQSERLIIWEKIKRLRPHMMAMNQGAPLLPNSAAQVAVAAALSSTLESRQQKWHYASQGNFLFIDCLTAYHESQNELAVLKLKCAGLEFDLKELREINELQGKCIESLFGDDAPPESEAENVK